MKSFFYAPNLKLLQRTTFRGPVYSLHHSYGPIHSHMTRTACLQSRFYAKDNQLPKDIIIDGRARVSAMWYPEAIGIAKDVNEDSHSKLIRAGYLRQAHSGIFHMLPLGRRLQDKLEALIDKHMGSLGASKVALSSISSEQLWAKSGRLENAGPELFRFLDRKEAKYVLSPTHEEEITSLVASAVTSYKQLPVRLYQISRKYRDELRPRQGLLRSREFVMKDLYTFDYSAARALKTYEEVRQAYTRLFDKLKIPYLVADADSGQIGGDLSHEFHFPTAKGEDNVISCDSCGYVANEELAESAPSVTSSADHGYKAALGSIRVWRGISEDKSKLINVWYSTEDSSASSHHPVNLHAIKKLWSELDSSIENYLPFWQEQQVFQASSVSTQSPPIHLVNLVDSSVPAAVYEAIKSSKEDIPFWPKSLIGEFTNFEIHVNDRNSSKPLNLLRIQNGDRCGRCATGSLKVEKAIELGHTFHLGTKYSEPLEAMISIPSYLTRENPLDLADAAKMGFTHKEVSKPMQMGCHGIGVSRLIGAVADTLADDVGLNWPRAIAPYEVVIISNEANSAGASEVYDILSTNTGEPPMDVIIDDRTNKSLVWKFKDADLIGYPVQVIVGKGWVKNRTVEISCRRLNSRLEVPLGEVVATIQSLLVQL